MNRNGFDSNGAHLEPLHFAPTAAPDGRDRLGMVTSGSLTKGLDVKLDAAVSVEAPGVQVGRYVVINGERQQFFGMITDVALRAIDAAFEVTPPDVDDDLTAEVLRGTATYGQLHVLPSLSLPTETIRGAGKVELKPVRTIPAHYSAVNAANNDDVARIFGDATDINFWVGNPLDMESKVCLDIKELIKRSNGVFGKSGTGKSFLTRLLLAGLVQAAGGRDLKAVNLIFDMHNDYGWESASEDTQAKVKGLKALFGASVGLFTLDPESSRRRGGSDVDVKISFNEIEPEDFELLRQTLNLTELMVAATYDLQRAFPTGWLVKLLDTPAAELKELMGSRSEVALGTLEALRRRVQFLDRLKFLTREGRGNAVKELIDYLENGKHVVLEFGRYGNESTAYVLVANLLTRRIHKRWVDLVEAASGPEAGPPQLVITIEEAHKFLNSGIAEQTIFGIIAREMRKYRVTLLVVDQRPSGIDDEVLSQLGTKLCCLLDNEKDVDAVLSGVSGRSELREVLSKLETKQQALVFGHAVPMPVVIRVRDWGEETYAGFSRGRGRSTVGRDIL